MDRNNAPVRPEDQFLLECWDRLRWTVLVVVVSYSLLAFASLFLLRETVPSWRVGDVKKAKARIEHCQSKDEILAILGKPGSRNDKDTVWNYNGGLLGCDGLEIRFDAQGRPIETKAWLD